MDDEFELELLDLFELELEERLELELLELLEFEFDELFELELLDELELELEERLDERLELELLDELELELDELLPANCWPSLDIAPWDSARPGRSTPASEALTDAQAAPARPSKPAAALVTSNATFFIV